MKAIKAKVISYIVLSYKKFLKNPIISEKTVLKEPVKGLLSEKYPFYLAFLTFFVIMVFIK